MSVQVKGSGTIGGLDEGLNVVGVVTATSFSGAFTGDVTGTASQVTIAGGADNRIITASSANTLSGESTLTYDGTYLDIGGGVTRFTKQGSYNSLEIGYGQNGNQNAFIDLIGDTTYTDYGTRIIRYGQNGANGTTDILHRGTGSLNLQTSDAADIVLKTNGNNERLRIASNGQVSISSDGTTDGLLTIKGDTDQVGTPSIRLLDGSDTREVSITNTSGDFVASVHGNDNAIHGHIKLFESGIIDFNNGGATGSNTNRLRIDTNGRVLIGTNSTHNSNSYSNNLIIYENGDTGASIIGNNSNSNYASLYLSDTSTSSRSYLESQLGSNGNFTIGQNGTGRIRYVLNGSEKFCMTHTGRFGVGDTDPDFAVHLKSNVPALCFEDTDGTHGQAIIEQNGDELKIRQDAGNASSGTGSTILFQVDASTKMRIDGTGYVGINRNSPTHYLDVDGTSLFRGRVFISGSMSMKSTPFGANVTYDTGISVNGGGYGGSILAICSKNFGAGTNTQSGVYLLKFHYDGNTGPSVTLIAGSNLATFGKSGSNTLTVFMGASNNMFTAIESSVVNA